MPLLKKTPFALLEPSKDLEPHELVYQVRFTKELFRNYQHYLNRLNLYRQRIWTCEVSGKSNLTYEEALVSEKRTTEKVQEIPKELVPPALHIIQFSMLSLKDLADAIASKLQEHLFVGAELHGKKDDGLYPCKILKVLKEGNKIQYEVSWLDGNKKMKETAVVNGDDLIQKKLLLSRNILKSFIRKSTYRSAPWIVHEKLARKHGVSSDPPQELKDKVYIHNGLVICDKKRRKNVGDIKEESRKPKRKKVEGESVEAVNFEKNNEIEDQPEAEPIKYPIDDLLVQPGADDPIFTERPSPSRDFSIQMDCIGDLLMVWDFCSSFSRLLNLWPFSLDDFENSICHKDSNLILIVETHSSLLRLLIKDNGEYFLAVNKRNRKSKITLITWTEYLCDFLETSNIPDLSTYTSMIKRGHYGLLDAHTKLRILQQLVNQVLETDLVKEKLDEYIDQRRMLGATRRGEAMEEARKKREEKEQKKSESVANLVNGHNVESIGNNLSLATYQNHSSQNGEIAKEKKGEVISSTQNHFSDKSDSYHSDTSLKKAGKKQNGNMETVAKNAEESYIKRPLKQLKDEKKDSSGRRNKEQRKEYFEREIEKRVVRTNPLGKDRDYNRYWWFRRDGRIFVESCDSKLWGYYSSKEELDALMGSLNCKGERERALKKQLEKFYNRICMEIQKKSKEAERIELDEAVLRRSTRVRALPRENAANAFLRYVNKWKED